MFQPNLVEFVTILRYISTEVRQILIAFLFL